MNTEPQRFPSPEQQADELMAAGWIRVRRTLWKAPVGGYFTGPHGAWKAMKRRQGKANLATKHQPSHD